LRCTSEEFPGMPLQKLSVVIPAYNEESTIYDVLLAVHGVLLINDVKKEMIVVDDCSTDETGKHIQKFISSYPGAGLRYIRHEVNMGKGAAIKTAIEQCNGDYIVIQDADLELKPEELNLLLQPVFDQDADVVYGSRFSNQSRHKRQTNRSYYANQFLTWLSNRCSGLRLTDMETCYKLVRAEHVKKIRLEEMRFGFEPEITAKLSKIKNIRFAEVPVTYETRTKDEGKKIGWKDGVRAVYCIIKYNFFR